MRRQPLSSPRMPAAQASESVSRPAPVGGLNTRDPLSAMSPADAVMLDNFVARPNSIETRLGSTDWKTGLGSAVVESLLPYFPPSGSSNSKLFAATSGGIYDATTSGSFSASVSASTNGRWQHVNFSTSAGSYLLAVNGTDSLTQYNGTAWSTTATLTFGAGTIATSEFVHINIFKSRLFFVRKNSLQFYYMQSAGAISGVVLEYNLNQLFTHGGYLVAMATWSLDAANGPDDYAAFLTSEGQVAVFQGTDPASLSTWSLVGVYTIARPLGRRCAKKLGGDVMLVTERGLYPLAKALQSANIQREITLSDKIYPTLVQLAAVNGATFGWDVEISPTNNFLLLNVPSTPKVQYVMDLQSQSWSRFTGLDASCWAFFNGALYFGTAGKVVKAYEGYSDNGNAIVSEFMTAYSYLAGQGQNTHLELVRPTFASTGRVSFTLGGNVDYSQDRSYSISSVIDVAAAKWDTALWDVAAWSADYVLTQEWQTLSVRPGFCFSLYGRIQSQTVQTTMLAVDYVYKRGGVL